MLFNSYSKCEVDGYSMLSASWDDKTITKLLMLLTCIVKVQPVTLTSADFWLETWPHCGAASSELLHIRLLVFSLSPGFRSYSQLAWRGRPQGGRSSLRKVRNLRCCVDLWLRVERWLLTFSNKQQELAWILYRLNVLSRIYVLFSWLLDCKVFCSPQKVLGSVLPWTKKS